VAATPDPYATLGVPRGASLLEIARARRRLAKRFHPDVAPAPEALARMRSVNAAWELLSNPAARQDWDLAHAGASARHWPEPRTTDSWVEWPRATATPTAVMDQHSASGWIALGVVTLLLVGLIAMGVLSTMSRPATRGADSPGYHDNLSP
jgi:DnaJ-like protein